MSTPEPRLRVFVGLPLPDAVREPLGEYLTQCARLAPEQRWSPPANLHLTLHFLGSVGAGRVDRVAEALAAVRQPPFRLQLGGLGRFGTAARPRVLWMGVAAGRAPLSALAGAVAARCREAGVAGDERPYNPHLTLCRVRPSSRLPDLPDPVGIPGWDVGSFMLFQSRPGPRGSVYVPLREFELGDFGAPPGNSE